VEDKCKQEILVAIATSQEETSAMVAKVITDQIAMRAELGAFRVELDAVKARGVAWDAADAGHARALADGLADARRIATETKTESEAALEAAGARHNELAGKVTLVHDKLDEIKQDVGGQVLEALGAHVHTIEEAADKLTRSPRVKVAATVGGAFAGSAVVAAFLEILKHL
jgi:hypothetical protein